MKVRLPLLSLALYAAMVLLSSIVGAAEPPDTQPAANPLGSSPADTAPIATNLREIRIDDLDLREASLRDALSLIGLPSGLNLAASDEAAKTKVTIRLRNVTPLGAVQAICQTHGLFFNPRPTDEGVDVVTTVKEFQQGVTIFRQEKTEVYTLLYPNAEELAVAIHDLYGNRVQLTRGKEDVFDDSDELSRRLSRFDIINNRSQGLAQAGLSAGSGSGSSSGNGSGGGGGFGGGGSGSGSGTGSSNGGGSSYGGGGGSGGFRSLNGGSGNGYANQPRQDDLKDLTPDQLDRLSKLLKQQGAGVGFDAEQLATLKPSQAQIYVSVISRNNQVIVRTSDPAVLEEIAQLKSKIDVPTPQVLLEVKVLSVDLTDGFNSVFDYQFGDQHSTAGFSTGSILPPVPAAPLVPTGTGESGSPFGLNTNSLIYQFVNNNFRARMQLLQNRNKVTTLATPLLLVANNEVSRVFIGQERPIVQNITSQTTATQGVVTNSPTTSINFVPVGTTLLITPNINADRTVTLRLIQENSQIISGGATIPIVASNGSVTNEPVDVVSAQSLSGTLVAKDGLSLALGGLIEESVTDTREEIPVLGELPYIGIFFRRQVTGRDRHEVIVVIRPYILSTPAEAEAVGKRVVDANSLHPKTPELNPAPGEPIGTMKTFLPHEALRPDPPQNQLQQIFRFHDVLPTDF